MELQPHTYYSDQPKFGQELVGDNQLPYFRPCFQLRTNQRKPKPDMRSGLCQMRVTVGDLEYTE